MPPLYAQDPLAAVERGLGWGWLDVPLAIAGGATEPWVVALLALALYSWLEQEVREVLASFLPLAVAMAIASGGAILARSLGAIPRPVAAGPDAGPALHLALEGANVVVAATFAAYSLLAYGGRAGVTLAVVLAAAGARAAIGAGLLDLAGAAGIGLVLGASSYGVAVRLLPGGHLAALRAARRRARAAAAPPGA